jgi:hypothetical protein
VNEIKPNLVLKNGSIYAVDVDRNRARAIAIADGKIAYVGSDEGVEAYIQSESVVIDLDGKMVLPGFVDAHAHPSDSMGFFNDVNLYLQTSLEEHQATIAEFAESHPHAEVIRGGGWDNALFPQHGPSKVILDTLIPDRPVALISNDGHSLWANSVTLERAQIAKETPNPEGGVIERDPETGEPNGTLRETAIKLVENALPDYSIEERKIALLAYQEMATRAGITLSHDAMLDAQSIAAFKELEKEGLLKMRFRGSITLEPDREIEPQIETILNERSKNKHPYFQTIAAKIFVDGVVEGGTAYLLEPYENRPEFRGEPIWGPEILNQTSVALDKENIQIHIHVIGDAAARIALDALECSQQSNGKRDSRHMITHLQLVSPEDILRFKQLGVIGLPQPFWFLVDDYYWKLALPYLGKERANLQYPMQSLFDAGVIMASASDFPVTIPCDPLIGIQIGITRSAIGKTPEEILWPEEKSSLEDMIVSFTLNGAYANFLEKETGSLEIGKQADIVVLEQDLFEIPTAEIAKTRVMLTLVDGKELFRDSGFG